MNSILSLPSCILPTIQKTAIRIALIVGFLLIGSLYATPVFASSVNDWTFDLNSSYYGQSLQDISPDSNFSTTSSSNVIFNSSSYFNYGKSLVTNSSNVRAYRHNLFNLLNSQKSVFIGQLRGCDSLTGTCGSSLALLSGDSSNSLIEANAGNHTICYIKMFNGNELRAGNESVIFNSYPYSVSTSTPVSYSITVDSLNRTCKVWFSGVYTNGNSFSTTTSDFNFSTDSISLVTQYGITSMSLSFYKSSVVSQAQVFSNFSVTEYDSQYHPIICDTCTRVESHIPSSGDVLFETSAFVKSQVYLSSNDYANLSNTYVREIFSSVKAAGSYDGTPLVQIKQQPLTIDDELWWTFPSFVDFSAATGTWIGKTQIIERVYTGMWWNPFDNDEYTERILASSDSYRFHVLEPTSQQEEQSILDTYKKEQEALALTDVCRNEGTLSASCFMTYIDPVLYNIKYAPPQGYAFLLVDKLMATTTGTSSIGMIVSFPVGSPLRGHTLNLDTSVALSNSISNLQNAEIETLPNGAVNTFMKYWNYFCYIMLALWIVREIFGTFSFDFSYNSNGGKYQKSGDIQVRSAHGKNIKIKSYD